MEEIWKDIEGYEGIYQVSNCGRIKSLDRFIHNKGSRNGKGYFKNGEIKKQTLNNKGYFMVTFCKSGKVSTKQVSRLVAQAFIPNPYNKPEVDHIDTNPQNNKISNLKWVTSVENNNNELTLKHYSNWQKGKPKFTSKKVICLNDGKIFDSLSICEANYGLNKGSVYRCCISEYKQTKGYQFIYYSDYLQQKEAI